MYDIKIADSLIIGTQIILIRTHNIDTRGSALTATDPSALHCYHDSPVQLRISVVDVARAKQKKKS